MIGSSGVEREPTCGNLEAAKEQTYGNSEVGKEPIYGNLGEENELTCGNLEAESAVIMVNTVILCRTLYSLLAANRSVRNCKFKECTILGKRMWKLRGGK